MGSPAAVAVTDGRGALVALAALARRYGLDERQRERLATLLAILERDERAPTAVRVAGEAIEVHVADVLVGLELEPVRSAQRLVDIGAGAGFPGLVLAVALAERDVALLESQSRKCEFLRDTVARLGLAKVQVVDERAESWSAGMGAHDLAVARAVAAQPVLLEYAAPLLRLGGALVDWRGRRSAAEEDAALRAAAALGMRREAICRVEPFAGARDRHLHVFVKSAETPPRFPRRAGIARKRPLARA